MEVKAAKVKCEAKPSVMDMDIVDTEAAAQANAADKTMESLKAFEAPSIPNKDVGVVESMDAKPSAEAKETQSDAKPSAEAKETQSDAKPSAEAKPAAMDMETETLAEPEDTKMADAADDIETAEVPDAAVGPKVQAPVSAGMTPTSFQTPVSATMSPPMSRPHGKAAPPPTRLVPMDSGFVQPPDLKSAESQSDVITTLGRTPRKAPHSGNPTLVLQSDKKPPATRRRSSRGSHQKKQKHS